MSRFCLADSMSMSLGWQVVDQVSYPTILISKFIQQSILVVIANLSNIWFQLDCTKIERGLKFRKPFMTLKDVIHHYRATAVWKCVSG